MYLTPWSGRAEISANYSKYDLFKSFYFPISLKLNIIYKFDFTTGLNINMIFTTD